MPAAEGRALSGRSSAGPGPGGRSGAANGGERGGTARAALRPRGQRAWHGAVPVPPLRDVPACGSASARPRLRRDRDSQQNASEIEAHL